jgi:predicted ester cyclase
MPDLNSTTLYKWFDQVWNKGRREAIDELASKDVIANGLGPDGRMHGVEAFKAFYDDFRSKLTNIKVTVEKVLTEGNMETALCNVTATDIASGKEVEFTGICMAKISEGKITEAWNNYDFLKMYEQLGFTLAPNQPG